MAEYLAIAAVLVPLSAPFNNAWHHWYGVENLSAIWIVWSPPHLLLFGTLTAGVLLALPLLKRSPEPIHLFLGSYAWGYILTMSAVIVAPLYPFRPYHTLWICRTPCGFSLCKRLLASTHRHSYKDRHRKLFNRLFHWWYCWSTLRRSF